MSRHEILNFADHAALRVRTEVGAAFGDGVQAALAVPAEFRRLACEYPILFRFDGGGACSALALFGFEPDENLFLHDGRWDAVCKPLAIAVQPFLIGRAPDGQSAQVHIDMNSPRIAADGEGTAVFDSEGKPTRLLSDAIEMLGELDEGYRASADFFAALLRYDLLEPFSMDVTLDNGAAHRLVGYHLVDEEKLSALEPGALAELHRDGHLGPLYMAIASLGNMGKLVRRKNRRSHG